MTAPERIRSCYLSPHQLKRLDLRLVGAENAARDASKGHLIRVWKRTSAAIPAHVGEVSAA